MLTYYVVRICTKCKTKKPSAEYYADKRCTGGLRPQCKACMNEARRAGYKANPYRARAAASKWAKDNPDKKRSQARSAEWRAQNPEKAKASVARYKAANPEKVKASASRWARANPNKMRAACAKRRALKLSTQCEAIDRSMVYQIDKGICGICTEPVDENDYHLDHVYPLSRGGDHMYYNVQIAHPRCNLSKGAKVA